MTPRVALRGRGTEDVSVDDGNVITGQELLHEQLSRRIASPASRFGVSRPLLQVRALLLRHAGAGSGPGRQPSRSPHSRLAPRGARLPRRAGRRGDRQDPAYAVQKPSTARLAASRYAAMIGAAIRRPAPRPRAQEPLPGPGGSVQRHRWPAGCGPTANRHTEKPVLLAAHRDREDRNVLGTARASPRNRKGGDTAQFELGHDRVDNPPRESRRFHIRHGSHTPLPVGAASLRGGA